MSHVLPVLPPHPAVLLAMHEAVRVNGRHDRKGEKPEELGDLSRRVVVRVDEESVHEI